MIRNFISIAIRTLLRQKGFTLINILGLTIGLTVSALIILYVVHELSFDRFHENSDRLYRIAVRGHISEQQLDVAVSSTPFGPALKNDYPEVEEFTRMDISRSKTLLSLGEKNFYEDNILFADSAFFRMFTVPLLQGDPETALMVPRSILLSASSSRKYFGEGNPVGQVLRFNNESDLTVTGVFEDHPDNSHMDFNSIVSFSSLADMRGPHFMDEWGALGIYTYIMLERNANPDSLAAKLPVFLQKYFAEELHEANIYFEPYLQSIPSIHLHSKLMAEMGSNSDIAYIYILMAITVFILILACINFMNLSTAKSANRSREVGIRKVFGSDRKTLIIQFIGESVLMSLVSLFIAFFLIEVSLPVFNSITGKQLEMNYFINWRLGLGFLFLALMVGIFAGSYPSLYLSAFNPVKVLKGRLKSGSSNSLLRNVLVFIQFTVSISLVIGTMVIYTQLSYIKNKDLGFNEENVILIQLRNPQVRKKATVLKTDFLALPDVISVGLSNGFPGGELSGTGYVPEGIADTDPWLIYGFDADPDFIESTLGMRIISGRNFSADFSTDSTAVLINETLQKGLDWDDPIGKIILSDLSDSIPYRVIGVLRDFHDQSLHEQIKPIMLKFLSEQPRYMMVKIRRDHTDILLEQLTMAWGRVVPELPFDYQFLDERYASFYDFEKKLGKIFIYLTIFALFIAALGLSGLASYIAEQRTKEIGIRKAMGASIKKIIFILSLDFARPVLLANLVAWPLAWFGINYWLKGFEYQTGIHFWIFPVAGFLTFLVALLTINIQTFKAASSNPTNSLRYE